MARDTESAAASVAIRRWLWSLWHNGPRWTFRFVKVRGGLK